MTLEAKAAQTGEIKRSKISMTEGCLVYATIWALSHHLAPAPTSSRVWIDAALLQVFLVLGLPLFSCWLLKLEIRHTFRLRSTSPRNLLLTVSLTFCLILLLDEISFLQDEVLGKSTSSENHLALLLRADSFSQLIWILLSMAVIPAVCEEFLFRGFLLDRFLSQDNRWHSIMMSSILFGLFHQDLRRLVAATLAGALLGFIVIRTQSICNSILAHAFVNTWGVAVINSSISDYLPWVKQTTHVPYALQAICLWGIVVAGRRLREDKNPDASERP